MARVWQIFVFCAVIVGIVWHLDQRPQVYVATQAAIPIQLPTAAMAVSNQPSLPATAPDFSQLRTFQGAQVDGALRVNRQGELIIDRDLRRWIDFHLSAQGEVDLDMIVQWLQYSIQQLPNPGQQQATQLVQDYLNYLADLAEYDYEESKRIVNSDFDQLSARLAWQQRLREQWFDEPVLSAFFQQDQLLDQLYLTRLKHQAGQADSEQLHALEQALPLDVQLARQQTRSVLTLNSQQQQLQAQGADAASIQQWRIDTYGVEVAERLAHVDQQQAQWRERLLKYQDYVSSQAVQGLNEFDRERLLERYRQQHFDENEQKRLGAALALLSDTQP